MDNPQAFTLAVMAGGERGEVEEEDEEQTWDTRSNATTYLKTSASTWRCAFCCSRVAARRGLRGGERGRRDRLETDIAAWAPNLATKGLKHTKRTHQQLPQQDTYRRYIWSRRHAPSWGSRPERRDVEGSQRQ